MMVGDAVRRLDTCEAVRIYVGGLPAQRSGAFEYKAGFSPYDVIEEYVRPARIVDNFETTAREGLSAIETVDIPGLGPLEAFLTDGLRTLTTTVTARSMFEKTLRYPGHARVMRAFRDGGFFSKETIDAAGVSVRPLDVTAALLFPRWTFAENEPDITILRVVVDGKAGQNATSCTWDLIDRYDPATGLRSMARTTAFPAAIVADLVARGTLPPGVHAPETIGMRGLLDGVLEGLATRGVQCRSDVRPKPGATSTQAQEG
jgi:saccharopine dehydrogenase-like NADP-dependent oxidoreductase